MAIKENTFEKAFGRQSGNNNGGSNDSRPKAQLWLNVGYTTEVDSIVDGQSVTEEQFISLPVGIPVDTMEHLPTNMRNESFAQLRGAQNYLLDEVIRAADLLKPGETKVLNLQIQLRRVNDERAEVPVAENPMIKKLDL